MIDRLKKLRKELKLSQAAFAKLLGLSQSAIGDIESGKNALNDRNFNAICREFNVNPTWLRDGVGEMFLNPPSLDRLATEYDLTPEEVALIESFLKLPAADRQVIIRLVRNFAQSTLGVNLSKEIDERKPDEELTVAEKRRIVNEELDAEEKGVTSLVSTGSSGLYSKKSRKNS